MTQKFRCHTCHKKLFEGNLALLVQKRRQESATQPYIEVLCRGCKSFNASRMTQPPSSPSSKTPAATIYYTQVMVVDGVLIYAAVTNLTAAFLDQVGDDPDLVGT